MNDLHGWYTLLKIPVHLALFGYVAVSMVASIARLVSKRRASRRGTMSAETSAPVQHHEARAMIDEVIETFHAALDLAVTTLRGDLGHSKTSAEVGMARLHDAIAMLGSGKSKAALALADDLRAILARFHGEPIPAVAPPPATDDASMSTQPELKPAAPEWCEPAPPTG